MHTWTHGELGTFQNSQYTNNIHQEPNGTVKDNSERQLQGKNHHQVWNIPKRCIIPAVVLHMSKAPKPAYY